MRHLCCCHPRTGEEKAMLPHFDLSEGRMIENNTLFICHTCDARREKAFAVRQAQVNVRRFSKIQEKVAAFLTRCKFRFVQNYPVGKFEFDFAFPAIRVLAEVDGRTYHRACEEPDKKEFGEELLKPGTKAWTANRHGWTLVRVRNGPRLMQRFQHAVASATRVGCET